MKSLYIVRMKNTYTNYYVMAHDFNEAGDKVLAYVMEETASDDSIISKDGSLNLSTDAQIPVIRSIESLNEPLIL